MPAEERQLHDLTRQVARRTKEVGIDLIADKPGEVEQIELLALTLDQITAEADEEAPDAPVYVYDKQYAVLIVVMTTIEEGFGAQNWGALVEQYTTGERVITYNGHPVFIFPDDGR